MKELGLQDKVKFLGFVPDEDVVYLYDQAKALMFASLDEGFGLPIIQAIGRGLPVLTSDISVLRELGGGERTIYVDPQDVEGIRQGIRSVVQFARGIPSKKFFEKYSWNNTMKELISVVSEEG